jgi:hypothetical protein
MRQNESPYDFVWVCGSQVLIKSRREVYSSNAPQLPIKFLRVDYLLGINFTIHEDRIHQPSETQRSKVWVSRSTHSKHRNLRMNSIGTGGSAGVERWPTNFAHRDTDDVFVYQGIHSGGDIGVVSMKNLLNEFSARKISNPICTSPNLTELA